MKRIDSYALPIYLTRSGKESANRRARISVFAPVVKGRLIRNLVRELLNLVVVHGPPSIRTQYAAQRSTVGGVVGVTSRLRLAIKGVYPNVPFGAVSC